MNYSDIFKYFPRDIGQVINENIINNYLEEIRFRVNKPIILKFNSNDKILNKIINREEILNILQSICENSIYSYQNEICQGFITINGGHRVGITGNVIFEDNKIKNINYISSLNFRIARQIIGCSNNMINYIIDKNNNSIYNTLIISPPGAGKTTLLRDLIRNLSNGNNFIKGKTISLIDERGEIASMYKGNAQNDIGIRTDVLTNIKKSIGMKMAIRSMSPEIIIADEIGDNEDVEAINYAICCGIKGIFTAHGGNIDDVKRNPTVNKLLQIQIFNRIIFLDERKKGRIKEIYTLDNKSNDYIKINFT